ncbi:MAG: glycoside hydrolase family 88 protein [Reichenbachiella sp.]
MKYFQSAFFLFLIVLFSCNDEQKVPTADEVITLTRKVADWQLENYEEQGAYRALPSPEYQKKWHHRNRYHDLEWIPAALYSGLYQFHTIADDPKYVDWLREVGRKNGWKLHTRKYHADDHAVGQMYLNLADYYKRNVWAQPTRKQFDEILESEDRNKWHWDWCDALFMAPPVWTRLSKVSKDPKYLNYMHEQYRMTYAKLWDQNEKLFSRDESFLDQKEKNGQKIFWSRGNGWVFGGLALMIPDFPENWKNTGFYTGLFQEMANTLKNTQREDGTWSAGILGDFEDYPSIETSGTSFFAFGLAWGINNGFLDQATYEPVLIKAWNALAQAVNEEGMLGFVQPVGAAPGESFENYSELYGSGAFLAAGTEMFKYLSKHYPQVESPDAAAETVFMENGGWCWYQDPRAVIKNGKLVIAGLDGQNGDVRLGVFDLQTEKKDGAVTLHKEMQPDDHDVPALYVRPDQSILAVWAKHANEKIHYYNISSSDDYMKWGDRKEFFHNYEHNSGVTYMNLYYMKDEGKLYNFFRDGPTFNPAFITSTDHGETWSKSTHFIANDVSGRHRPYARYAQVDENTVGISYTDGHPRVYGNSVYYAVFRNGSFYNVDGTKIKDLSEGPLRTSEGEKIYVGSETKEKPYVNESVPNSAWTCAMGKDAQNNPHIGYSLYIDNNDHRYRIASWDGKQWIDREIAYAGKCLYSLESSYTGLMAFDPEDPTQVFISTDVNPTTGENTGGKHEIYKATINDTDDISTIKWEAITSGSKYKNIRPIVVANEGYKALLWLHGPWGTYINYDVDVVGKILERPVEN